MPIERIALNREAARATCAALLRRAALQRDSESAWRHLQAAHIAGQEIFIPHLETHVRMLALACRTRDWSEAAGQLFRLVLVPLGHVVGRLPLGNPGRATVSAFRPLPVPAELQALIDEVRQALAPRP